MKRAINLFVKLFIVILHALMFCLHVYLCEGVRSLGTEAIDTYEALGRCQDLNSGPLEEQCLLLTCSLLLSQLFSAKEHFTDTDQRTYPNTSLDRKPSPSRSADLRKHFIPAAKVAIKGRIYN